MVPRLLNVDQKEPRMQVCQDIGSSVFKLNQTCSVESWNFEYDPETKRQRSVEVRDVDDGGPKSN